MAVLAASVGLAGSAQAQTAGISLSERLGLSRRPAASTGPVRRDPAVRQAAAAGTGKPSSTRSPRETAQNSSGRRSNGGLLSRFGLPNLVPESLRREDEGVEPPMPYDPEELSGGSSITVGPKNSRPRSSNSTSRGAQTGGASRNAPATNRGVEPRAAAPAPRSKPQPQTVRQSPRTDARRNELAEALSGLQDEAEPTAEPAAERAAGGLPSYLREPKKSPTASAARRDSAENGSRPTASGPLDVRDALLGKATARKPSPPAPAAETPVAPEPIADDEPANPAPESVARTTPAPKATAEAPTASADSLGSVPAEPSPSEAPPAPAAPVAKPEPAPVVAREWPEPKSALVAPSATSDVLLSCKQPIIVSRVEGPQRIVVGRPATYRITLENRGDDAARDVTATVAVPASADVQDAAATSGVVNRGADAGASASAAAPIVWQLYELAPRASQTLTLQLVPQSGQPMPLGVQWSHAPTAGQTTVEVQEPKLHVDIAGPAEVMFGKSQRFALTLTNPGTGAAEDVAIELIPPGGDASSTVHHRVGALAPGETKKIELELTAREAGELKIQAAALAAGNLRSDAVKTVLCRKAELEIDWRGPEKNYAGAVATYFFRVRNPGTAPAEAVAVNVSLPPGAEMIDASEGHAFDAAKSAVTWQAGALGAGEQRFMQIRCRLSQPGMNTMALAARTAGGDLADSKNVPVAVEALADLKLEVSDPKGIVAVGDAAAYEIHVRNRGTVAARDVNVVAMFSAGIEPSHVEGGQYAIRDGRVSFRTIESLPAGSEAVFRIHAKATQAGTHIFRAEVVCDDLETKLSAEETTRFFVEEQRWADASAAYGGADAPATR